MQRHEAEYVGNEGAKINAFGRVLVNLLANKGQFAPLDEIACVEVKRSGDFDIELDVHHVLSVARSNTLSASYLATCPCMVF